MTGVAWRYRVRPVRLDTRSSELYESRCCGSAARCSTSVWCSSSRPRPRLIIPDEWTAALGVTETRSNIRGLVLGGSPASAPRGDRDPVYRRRTKGPVSWPPPANDKMMYLVLVATICAGCGPRSPQFVAPRAYNYREHHRCWFAQPVILQPEINDRIGATHVPGARFARHRCLFILWPFHPDSSMPSARRVLKYLFRPTSLSQPRRRRGSRTETPRKRMDVGATRARPAPAPSAQNAGMSPHGAR
ncbi:respiratory nitrate reductase subunit gamma [Rhodococcus hoagii]|nr:respiratory nitrate reductase subunit gamma [Prescottella equi]